MSLLYVPEPDDDTAKDLKLIIKVFAIVFIAAVIVTYCGEWIP